MSRLMQLPTPPRTLEYVVQWASDVSRTLGQHLRTLATSPQVVTFTHRTPADGTYPLVYLPYDVHVFGLHVALVGSSPSCTVDIQYGTTCGSAGTSLFVTLPSVTSTTGAELKIEKEAVVDAGMWIWLVLSSVSSVDCFHLTTILEPL